MLSEGVMFKGLMHNVSGGENAKDGSERSIRIVR